MEIAAVHAKAIHGMATIPPDVAAKVSAAIHRVVRPRGRRRAREHDAQPKDGGRAPVLGPAPPDAQRPVCKTLTRV
ncbi:MAG TPA: DUF1059 domain-containing protein [Thermoplasmata archaeon]|nr:DUF1059 domain-containing protein [Thermoplasmata archaeon]